MNKWYLAFCLVSLGLGGCSVKGEYSCGVPDNGVRCQPMNETHKQLNDGTLNSLHEDPYPEHDDPDYVDEFYAEDDYLDTESTDTRTASASTGSASAKTPLPSIQSIRSKQAILSQPREMRIWFSRFTDPEGDLHDESFVFVRIDNGHWILDRKPVMY